MFSNSFQEQSLQDNLKVSLSERLFGYKHSNNINYTAINDSFQGILVELYSSADGTLNQCVLDDIQLDEVISFLSISHQFYIHKLIPEIEQSIIYAFKQNADLSIWNTLLQFFDAYKIKLLEHIKEEEELIFPAILETFKNSNLKNHELIFDYLKNHDPIEEELTEIIQIINTYKNAEPLNMPLNIFLTQIEAFESELSLHAHIEDLLLEPKVKSILNQ